MKRRNKGDGSIYFDKARNRFIASYYDKLDKRHVKRFKTKSEAREFLVSINSSLQNNTYISPNTITLGEWVITWLTTYKKPYVKESTYNLYTMLAAKIDVIANIKLQRLDASTLQNYFNNLESSANTKNEVRKLLNQCLKKALILDIISKNPILATEKIKLDHKNIEVFTVKEINTILRVLPTLSVLSKRYPLVLLAIITGARVGELLALTWNDINFFNNTISINKSVHWNNSKSIVSSPKTKTSIRVIDFPISAVPILKKLYNEKSNVLVFHTRFGNYVKNAQLNIAWHNILKKCNIPYRKFHCLRHTHASQLLNKGIPITEISNRLGHANPAITLKVYSHAIAGYGKKIANQIDQIYKIEQ